MKKHFQSKNDLSPIDNLEDLHQQMELTRVKIGLAAYELKEDI